MLELPMTADHIVAFKTIIRKEFLRFARIWIQTILPSVITMFLYITIFGNFIGDKIGSIKEFSYIEYIIPGLIIIPIITNSYMNVVGFFMRRFQKSTEELLVSPVPLDNIGWICQRQVLRAFIVGFAVYLVTIFFIDIPIHNLPFVLFITLLTAFLFSIAGFINAAYAKSFDDINIVPTFVLNPLTYLGGTFYSIESLPEIWQDVSLFNPIAYIVSVFRYGFLGLEESSIYLSLTIIIVFIVILFKIGLIMLEKGIGIKN